MRRAVLGMLVATVLAPIWTAQPAAAAWRDRIQEDAPHGEEPIVFASFARFREVLSGEGSLGASRAA